MAKYADTCARCNRAISAGETIVLFYDPTSRRPRGYAQCLECAGLTRAELEYEDWAARVTGQA